MIQPMFRKHFDTAIEKAKKAGDKKSKKKVVDKDTEMAVGNGDVTESSSTTSSDAPVSSFSGMPAKLFPVLHHLGPFLSKDIKLFVKILRILKVAMKQKHYPVVSERLLRIFERTSLPQTVLSLSLSFETISLQTTSLSLSLSLSLSFETISLQTTSLSLSLSFETISLQTTSLSLSFETISLQTTSLSNRPLAQRHLDTTCIYQTTSSDLFWCLNNHSNDLETTSLSLETLSLLFPRRNHLKSTFTLSKLSKLSKRPLLALSFCV